MKRLPVLKSFLIWALLLQISIPASLWHLISSHDDTGHCIIPEGDINVSEIHHHCIALDLALPVALGQSADFYPEIPYFDGDYLSIFKPFSVISGFDVFEIRGPPFSPVFFV